MSGAPVIIAGVGRSGTTAVFELLDGWFKALGRGGARLYEPYVWDSEPLFRQGALNPDGFTTQAFSARGMLAHVETPLFLTEPEAAHDAFVSRLMEGDAPDGVLKMIRGCGRLEAYSRLYPDAKIVGVVRNPFDSLNSAHLHFSLLGDEFHRSDKTRLGAEIKARFGDDVALPSKPDEKEHVWAAYWWLYMNRALAEHYAANPGRVMLLPYELLIDSEETARDRLAGFLDLDPAAAPVITKGRARTGVTSKANRVLSLEETDFLESFQSWYEDYFLDPLQTDGIVTPRYRLDGLKAHYSETTGDSLLRKYPTWRTSVGWRFAFDGRTGWRNAAMEDRTRAMEADLARLAQGAGRPDLSNLDALDARRAGRAGRAPRPLPRISVIISIHDEDDATLERAVGSALGQSLKPFEVILADDASGEETAGFAAALAASHAEVRHVRHKTNIGPGANRHIATLAAGGDWVSHMDADDLWLPGKLEAEWEALQGAEDPATAVAFSDVQIFQDGAYDHGWAFGEFGERAKYGQIAWLIRRDGPIPRDMLMAKALYRASGGFETYARTYEDWAFKMRLARRSNVWAATGQDGLRYLRRRDEGLSQGSSLKHLYWRWFALCRNADAEPDYQPLLREGFLSAAGLLPPYEWLHKLTALAFRRAVQAGRADARVRRAAADFLARADLDRPEGQYANELERFAHELIGGKQGLPMRKVRIVRSKK